MQKILLPEKDATLYSKYPNLNTGADEILELEKDQSNISRFLIKFPVEKFREIHNWNEIRNDARFFVKVFCADKKPLAYPVTVQCYMVREDWASGIGKRYNSNLNQNSEGSNWNRRTVEQISLNWTEETTNPVPIAFQMNAGFLAEGSFIELQSLSSIIRVSGYFNSNGLLKTFSIQRTNPQANAVRGYFGTSARIDVIDSTTQNTLTYNNLQGEFSIYDNKIRFQYNNVDYEYDLVSEVTQLNFGTNAIIETNVAIPSQPTQRYREVIFSGMTVAETIDKTEFVVVGFVPYSILVQRGTAASGSYFVDLQNDRVAEITQSIQYENGSFQTSTSISPVQGGSRLFRINNVNLEIPEQKFLYESGDIELEVTEFVRRWLETEPTSSYPNYGFLFMLKEENHQISNPPLYFYSSDTNSIYSPHLYLRVDDSKFVPNPQYQEIDYREFLIKIPNLKSKYKRGSRIRLRVEVEPKWLETQFSSSAFYQSQKWRLPQNSFYEIIELNNNDKFVDSGFWSKISFQNGNYFDLDLDNFPVEKLFKIVLKLTFDNGEVYYVDNNFVFEVTK